MTLDNFKKDFDQHRATYILGFLTLGVWLSQFFANGAEATAPINLYRFGALFGPDIIEHPSHLWRLVTPIFVHIGWEHFLLNFFTLIFIGRQIEEIFGSSRFFAVYLLSGIYGNILTFFIKPETLSAGASTALFGMFGAMAMLGYLTKNPSFQAVGKQFAVLIIVNLAINLFQTGVGIAGHIGGAIGGILLAAPFAPKILANKITQAQKMTFLAIYIISAVLMIIFAFQAGY
ncbi:rhomboid family intramembrane serine protease [Lactococcus insecticola]|uniref:Rhomboid family intramembrane serine protease n=2 Tax=Pseudolactococcus insecticola TaxID=2709158 RepID=A0A6A0B9R9_9LACT|nr:rhomboid family intramembrane serine protease [Lactococcus insecticola]